MRSIQLIGLVGLGGDPMFGEWGRGRMLRQKALAIAD